MIRAEKRGEQPIRKIPAIEAIEEGIKRSVELGRPVVASFGSLTMALRMFYIAQGFAVVGYIAKICGEVNARLVFASIDPAVLAPMEDVIKSNYAAAGGDAQNAEVRYIASTSHSFTSAMLEFLDKERPGAAFLFCTTNPEVAAVGETGARIGAFQVMGASVQNQVANMIAVSDYVLIGEEFTVAGAYLSKNVGQLGTIVGQDWGKAFVMGMIVLGGILAQFGITWLYNIIFYGYSGVTA